MKVSRLLPAFFLTAFTFLLSFSVTHAQTWYDPDWQFRKEITVYSSQVTGTHTDFPLLINITDSDLETHALTSGNDILFTASDGETLLDYEIETYSTGHLAAWVRFDSLSDSSADPVIFIYYGNPSAVSSLENPNGVWDTNYVMVHHLEETGGNHLDSTANTNDGTPSVTTQGSASGQINGADEFGGTPDYVDCGNHNSLDITGSITLEAWAYPTTTAAPIRIASKDATGIIGKFILWINTSGDLAFIVADDRAIPDPWYRAIDTTNFITPNVWFHVVGVFDAANGEVRLYKDGSEVASVAGPASLKSNSEAVTIGASSNNAHNWTGTIDEVRISNTARSAEWIQTSYNNQSAPGSFYNIAPEEPKCTDDTDCGFCEKCDTGICVLQAAGEDTKEQCSDTECGTGSCDGSGGCGIKAAGIECRAAAGLCDLPETCDGISATCPADVLVSALTVCRPSAGDCDVAESCDGISSTCPNDTYLPAGNPCRPSAGLCDLAESCNGSSATCPADAKSTALCRSSAGPCDLADYCDGINNDCPSDAKSTSECRPASGVCDLAEYCDGISNTCPADALLPASTACRAPVGDCDLTEFCDGISSNCPTDIRSTAECRPASGVCDLAEYCDGERETCPPDILMPPGTICRLKTGFCDVYEFCDGVSDTCPADLYASTATVCRSAAGPCDAAENCTGSSPLCPPDLLKPDGSTCNDALYCTLIDQCQDGQCTGFGNPCTPPLVCNDQIDQCEAALPGSWWNNTWPNRKLLTIAHSNVDDDLTDFPVLIDLTDSDLGTYALNSGEDIVFTDANGVQLSHEIELFDSVPGHLIAWVNVPSLLSTQDTTLYIYFGNPDATSQEDPAGTWNSNYVMVQHLNEITGTHYDSTGNANDGATVVVTDQDAPGFIQGGDEFDGIGDYVKVPDAPSLQFGESSFTAEAWIFPESVPDVNGVRIVNNRGSGTGGLYAGWQLKITDSGGNWIVGPASIDDAADNYMKYEGTTTYDYNQWHHLAMVYEADNELRFYVNGDLDGTLFIGSYGSLTNSLPTVIGASLANAGVELPSGDQPFDGIIDEVRLSNLARSAGWISTSFRNQNDPTGFCAPGSLESFAGPMVSDPNPGDGSINVSIATTELSFTLSDPDDDPMDYMITTNPPIGSDYVTEASSGIHTLAVSGLDYDTTYQWVISVTDGNDVTNRIYSFTTQQASTIWWDHNWDSRKKLTIPSDKLDATLYDFPLLVDVTDLQLASGAQLYGDDIVFTDEVGNKLSHEIESYDSETGRLTAWVKVPILSSTEDTILYIYFGNGEAGNQEEPSGTWNDNYVMVHHLNEVDGLHYDSTINGNDGMPSVTIQGEAPGQIGGSDNFDGNNDSVDCGNGDSLDITGSLTVEAWAVFTPGELRNRIVAKDATGIPGKFIFWQDAAGDLTFQVYNSLGSWCLASAPISPDGSWMHVVGVFDTTDQRIRLYKDGIEVDAEICPGIPQSNTEAVTLGSSSNNMDNFNGMLDEVRISNVARSAEWIQASHSNQRDPVSYSIKGDVEAQCEGNFDCDYDCDGSDALQFKRDFGRSRFLNPCGSGNPCNGNFDCDEDVDGSDAQIFKQDFGRSPFSTPCPPCVAGEWCIY